MTDEDIENVCVYYIDLHFVTQYATNTAFEPVTECIDSFNLILFEGNVS